MPTYACRNLLFTSTGTIRNSVSVRHNYRFLKRFYYEWRVNVSRSTNSRRHKGKKQRKFIIRKSIKTLCLFNNEFLIELSSNRSGLCARKYHGEFARCKKLSSEKKIHKAIHLMNSSINWFEFGNIFVFHGSIFGDTKRYRKNKIMWKPQLSIFRYHHHFLANDSNCLRK